MIPKSERSLRASEFVRTRLSRVRRCRTALDRESVSFDTTDVAKGLQTLFLISSDIRLLFGEDVSGVSFELLSVNVSGMPNEVLEELVAILLLHNDTSGLDDVLDILNKPATVGTELVLVDRGMVENIFQRVVDLSVVG